jgi:hypothetical protein
VLNREKRLVGIVALGDLALRKTRKVEDALYGISRHNHKDSNASSCVVIAPIGLQTRPLF